MKMRDDPDLIFQAPRNSGSGLGHTGAIAACSYAECSIKGVFVKVKILVGGKSRSTPVAVTPSNDMAWPKTKDLFKYFSRSGYTVFAS